MMKATALISILVTLLVAASFLQFLHRSTLKMNSDSESAKIFGAFEFVEVGLFSKCGVANKCKENTCPDENCTGFKITPVPGAPNQECSKPDLFSVCVSTEFGFLVGFVPPKCATMGPACEWVVDEVTGIGSCLPVVGQGFTTNPTGPETCTDANILELVF